MQQSNKVIHVPALEKGLNIVEYLAHHGQSFTLKQLSVSLDIPSMTTYRIVKYLCSRGYLKERFDNSGKYGLGPQFLYISSRLIESLDLISLSKSELHELVESTGQVAKIGILKDNGVMYIDQALPSKPVHMIAGLRVVLPVNVSAIGKVLVAYLPPDEQIFFIRRCVMESRTPRSVVDKQQFQKELADIKKKGFARDCEEFARGIGGIAAPVLNINHEAVASIGLTGHIGEYYDKKRCKLLVKAVIKSALSISRHLGYRENY